MEEFQERIFLAKPNYKIEQKKENMRGKWVG
jgi:hypothetical protein